MLSDAYVQLRKRGPFPDSIDPWAEAAHYFHQIHAGMIGALLAEIQDPLLARGYQAGREASLQILTGREPDIFVHRAMDAPQSKHGWDYVLAAEELLANPGLTISGEIDTDAIAIREVESGRFRTMGIDEKGLCCNKVSMLWKSI